MIKTNSDWSNILMYALLIIAIGFLLVGLYIFAAKLTQKYPFAIQLQHKTPVIYVRNDK